MTNDTKPLEWIGSTKKDLKQMPEEVQDTVGYALHLAQVGLSHPKAKVLTGFGSAGVLEVVENYQGDAYRAVYTVKLANAVYVLHCFQKKSVKGISTPKPDMELIRKRIKFAEKHAQGVKK